MRDQAIITLPLGCFDIQELKVDQNPKRGVQTKFSEDYYNRKLAEYGADKKLRKKILDSIDQRADERLEELNQDLGFAVTAQNNFNKGDDHKKREIVSYLGSNLVLTNHILTIDLKKPLKVVSQVAETANKVSKKFGPLKNADNLVLFKHYLSESPAMRG